MTKFDRWTENFKCRECGKVGTASLSQEKDLIAVADLSEGLKVVGPANDPDVVCVNCNVSAWP
jgi:hypothetical protein